MVDDTNMISGTNMISDTNMIYNTNLRNAENFINLNETSQYKWNFVEYEELKLGDVVVITYISYSQKNIYDLYPKFGRIIKIDNLKDIDDCESYTIENIYLYNDYNGEYNAAHDWCGYYGNTKAYNYIIKRLEFINNP